jgi:hypothetical protein
MKTTVLSVLAALSLRRCPRPRPGRQGSHERGDPVGSSCGLEDATAPVRLRPRLRATARIIRRQCGLRGRQGPGNRPAEVFTVFAARVGERLWPGWGGRSELNQPERSRSGDYRCGCCGTTCCVCQADLFIEEHVSPAFLWGNAVAQEVPDLIGRARGCS